MQFDKYPSRKALIFIYLFLPIKVILLEAGAKTSR